MGRRPVILKAAFGLGLVTVIGVVGGLVISSRAANSRSAEITGLRITASIDRTQLHAAEPLHIYVQLRNVSATTIELRKVDCAAVRPTVWDSSHRVLLNWHFMCPIAEPQPPVITLAPGESRTESECLEIYDRDYPCLRAPANVFAAGDYSVGGMIYDRPFPEVHFSFVGSTS
jgi:hypothetical protein